MNFTLRIDVTLSHFIRSHNLPPSYASTAQQWFYPCFEKIITQKKRNNKPLVIAINGSQGSGKSTFAALLCDYATQAHKIGAISLSIDDFYLTQQERSDLATKVHPLLATRGVPGTHDIGLATKTLQALLSGSSEVRIPRFDKARDDRRPNAKWDSCNSPIELIVVEGWCLGAKAQADSELVEPINALEMELDPKGIWRNYINLQLAQKYQEFFTLVDSWVMLKAPSFDCVFNWRLEQEEKLRASLATNADASGVMNADQVRHFIKHYQRVTEHCLKVLPETVNFLYELDEHRQIASYQQRDMP